jgi:hypothetical protein
MKTLVSLYNGRSEMIKSQLMASINIQDVFQILKNEINEIYSEYHLNTTDYQSGVAGVMISSFNTTLHVLGNLDNLVTSDPAPTNSKSMFVTTDQIGGALGGSTIAAFVGGFTGLALGTIIGTLISSTILAFKPLSPQAVKVSHQGIQQSNVESLLLQFQKLLSTIDRAVETYGTAPIIPGPSIEDHRRILEYFQNLIGDSYHVDQIPPLLELRLKEAVTLIRHYGIEIVDFQGSEEDDAALEMFEFEKSLDPNLSKYVTLLPALIKDGKVVLPGRVIRP